MLRITADAPVVHRYFGRFNKSRRDRWVFGDRASGAYLHKFAWTSIVRHQIVKGGASADDPALAEHWAWRRRRAPLPIDNTSLWLLGAQDGRCPICEDQLLAVDDRPQSPLEWEQWLATTRMTIIKVTMRAGSTSDAAEPRLVHAHCRAGHHVRDGGSPALLPAYKPTGLA